jgi:Ca-activated chloride channel family protein
MRIQAMFARVRRSARRLSRRRTAFGLAVLALSIGGIVLLRAPFGRADNRPTGLTPEPVATLPGGIPSVPVRSGQTRIDVQGPALTGRAAIAQAAVAANGTRRLYASVRLSAAPGANRGAARAPVAMAIVLDVSGSMYSAGKLEQARNAVAELVRGMNADDWVTIVKYDDNVEVVQPLVRVGDSRDRAVAKALELGGGGGTLIPQALERGTDALAGAPPHLVRRVVLVSDGIDGSGRTIPQITGEVRGRAERGVALSALGIGSDYSEEFMAQVAEAGRGNYGFLAGGADLQEFLRKELREASATVVDDVVATAVMPQGWRLVRALGADAVAQGNDLRLSVGPMSAGDQRTVVLEIDVPAGAAVGDSAAGSLGFRVGYRTVADAGRHEIGNVTLPVGIVATEALAEATRDLEIWGEAQATVVYAEQDAALAAWQSGDIRRARELTQQNLGTLRAVARRRPSARLSRRIAELEGDDQAMRAMPAASAEAEHYRRAGRATRFADMH